MGSSNVWTYNRYDIIFRNDGKRDARPLAPMSLPSYSGEDKGAHPVLSRRGPPFGCGASRPTLPPWKRGSMCREFSSVSEGNTRTKGKCSFYILAFANFNTKRVARTCTNPDYYTWISLFYDLSAKTLQFFEIV